jgi:hypothetical protein
MHTLALVDGERPGQCQRDLWFFADVRGVHTLSTEYMVRGMNTCALGGHLNPTLSSQDTRIRKVRKEADLMAEGQDLALLAGFKMYRPNHLRANRCDTELQPCNDCTNRKT